tara:strand:- start:16286 stop:18988 length:2703 start_codon:yes stop_codon:yes gene_type:complete
MSRIRADQILNGAGTGAPNFSLGLQVGAATTIHTTGIDLGSGNIQSHNINSTGIITATGLDVNGNGDISGELSVSGNVSIAGTLTYEDVTSIDSVGVITAKSGINVTAGGINAVGVVTATTFTGNLTGNVTGDLTGNLAGTSSIAGISSTISDTAVDVFVYDTSKDSDGGAWRKRTQNTSWYNETLNTSTRGSRREFPAVAVIVAEATIVTIYDGDDPDLPMWMVFNVSNTTWFKLHGSGSQCSCVTALNATLCAGGNGAGIRLAVVDFIKDNQYLTEAGHTYYQTSGIITRNDTTTHTSDGGSKSIVNNVVNDVVMTVLPNAPIDDTTGLPIPTIAVATDGGISFILDDGNVVNNYRGTNDVTSIAFDKDNSAIFAWGTTSGAPRHITRLITSVWRVASSSSSLWPNNYFSGYNEGLGNSAANFESAASGVVTVANSGRHFGIEYATGNTNDRLGILHPNDLTNYADKNLSAFISSSYNTGYMHGNIKGAFLSDTDTTNVTGSNLIDNGDFGTGNFTNWSTSGTTAPSISSGGALLTTGAADGAIWQSTSGEATSGKWVITWTITSNSGGFFGLFLNNNGANGSGGALVKDNITASGSYYYEGSITAVEFRHRGSSSGIIDNITLRRVEDDRSVNNKGLQVFGTVTKSAVATGAELVAYSGFSASNYLKQPYNSDLAPGTGQYSVTCWFKTATNGSGDQYIFDRGVGGSNSRNLMLVMQTSGRIQFYHTNSSGSSGASDLQTTDMPSFADNSWHQVVGLYDGSAYRVYVDGKASSVTNTTGRDVGNDGTPALNIGARFSATQTFDGSMALFRYSRSAPSAEQIKKMYEDEKCLFQENAKATLYGSSDAVTALAFDDTTNLLHVGTSAGRSEFQGLRRINNTTTAVTTAISVSDGLVTEQ